MNTFSLYRFSIAIFLVACLFNSCSKKSSPNPVTNTVLGISSLSVNEGQFNTVVIIYGTGFSSVIANDQVSFNGKAATVTAVSSTSITTVVPVGAGTGNVTVLINGNSVTGPIFIYDLTATVSTLAGNVSPGANNGTGASASFNDPYAVATDANGNVYVADLGNNLIRKITPAGVVSTLAGSGATGAANGTGVSASFNSAQGIVVDASGNVYVSDNGNLLIRKITPGGVVSTFAGSGAFGSSDGLGVAASFDNPSGLAIDNVGNIYVVDQNNLRAITPSGLVSTLNASFGEPLSAAYYKNNLFVSDASNNTIREITNATASIFAGSGKSGSANGNAALASFNFPSGLTVDASGNLYVADTNNNLIRMIIPGGTVSTLAGGAKGVFPEINGVGTAAGFDSPTGIAFDVTTGILYVADATGDEIRKIVLQ